jgi:hypothetical protein
MNKLETFDALGKTSVRRKFYRANADFFQKILAPANVNAAFLKNESFTFAAKIFC